MADTAPPVDTSSQTLAFNTQTQTPQLVSPDDVAKNPGLFTDINQAQVKMLGPNGEHYAIPGSQLQSALDKGWTLPTSEQILHSQKVQETVAGYESGVGNAFAANFASALGGGVGDIIEAHAGRGTAAEKEASDVRAEAKAQLLENHQTQAALGTAAGFLGNLAVTGGLGNAIGDAAEGAVLGGKTLAQAGLGRAVAAKAAGGVAQGAFYAAPQAVAETAYGDPETAAETMLWGIGTGGIIGAGSELVKAGMSGLASKAAEKLTPEFLNQKADEMIAKRAGINPQGANKLGSERLGKIAKVIESENIQPGFEGASALRDDAGMKLGEHFKQIDDMIAKDPSLSQYQLKAQDVANTIRLDVEKAMGGLHTGLDKTALSTLDTASNAIVEQFGDKALTFSEAQDIAEKLRRDLPKNAFFANADDKVNAEVRRSVYDMFREKQMQMAEDVYKSDPAKAKQFADYLSQKQRYMVGSDLLRFGEKEFTNANFGSPIDTKGVMSSHLMGFAGSIAGSAAGNPLVGYLAGKVGYKFLGHYLDNMADTYGAKALRGLANSEWLPQLMAKHGVTALSDHLEQIGDYLGPAVYKGADKLDPFKQFLGPEETNGVSKQKQYEKVAQAITNAATDDSMQQSQVEAIQHVFGKDPALAQLLAQKQNGAIQYLYSALPKNPNPPQPFQANNWSPTYQQMKDFADRLEVVQNPMSVMARINTGTLTTAHVEALQQVYPKMYQQMTQQVALAAHSPNATQVSNGVKLSLEKLTGVNLTNPNNVNYQAAYQQAAPQQQPQGGAHHKQPQHVKLPAKMPNMYETRSQRLSFK